MKRLKYNTDLMWRYIIKILLYMIPSTKPSLLERVWEFFKMSFPLERVWEMCKKFLSKEKAKMVLRYPLRTVLQIKRHSFLGNEKSRLGTIEYVKLVFSSTCIFVKMPKIYFLMCVFTLAISFLHGQGYYTEQDTTEMKNALMLDNNDTKMSSQDQSATSDSLKKVAYWIQLLKDVVNVKKDVLYGQEVTAMVSQLQDSNFVLVQPVVSIDAKGVVIGLINQVGSLFEGNNAEPWLKLDTRLKPLKDREVPFSLSASATASSKVKKQWLDAAKAKMDSVYKGKTYQTTDLAAADIEAANLAALTYLAKAIGRSFVPPFMLKFNNKKYWGGAPISLWQQTGPDSTVMLEATTTQGGILSGNISWACSTLVSTNYDQAWVNVKKPGNSTLTVTYQDSLKQTFTLNVSTSDLKELLVAKAKDLLSIVCQEIIQSTYDSYTARRDSMMQKKISAEKLPNISVDESQVIGAEEQFDIEEMELISNDEQLEISAEQAKGILGMEVFTKTAEFKKTTQKTAENIMYELQLLAIAKEIVNPEKFESFKKEVTDNLLENIAKLGISTLNSLIYGDSKNLKTVLRGVTIEMLVSLSKAEFENE